ncbi:MAG TPA: hypothetical protein PLK35_02490 [Candidatus Moranbacteria bacterium]|nr:hypothetical protein [Candidatus Moranbacteria bacterium]
MKPEIRKLLKALTDGHVNDMLSDWDYYASIKPFLEALTPEDLGILEECVSEIVNGAWGMRIELIQKDCCEGIAATSVVFAIVRKFV